MMSRPVLQTRNLGKDFKGFSAVRNVNLDIATGSIHALIGPNGAGKTTVFNLLTRFLAPTSGTIVFDGEDITRRRPADVARLGIVRSFQISAVFAFALPLGDYIYASTFVSSTASIPISSGVPTEPIRGDIYYWQSLMVAAAIVTIPLAIAYGLLFRKLVRGFQTGPASAVCVSRDWQMACPRVPDQLF